MDKKWLWILGVVLAVGATVTVWVERAKNNIEVDRGRDSAVSTAPAETEAPERSFSEEAGRELGSDAQLSQPLGADSGVTPTPPQTTPPPSPPPAYSDTPPPDTTPDYSAPPGPMSDSGSVGGYEVPNYDAPPPPPPEEDYTPPPPPQYGDGDVDEYDTEPGIPPPPPMYPDSPPPYEDFAPPVEEY